MSTSSIATPPTPSSKNTTPLSTMPYISDTPSPTALSSMPPPSSTIPLHIRTKNRRKLYLDAHPSYFESPDLELADPLLYDKCIRRFQTSSEREADGKKKGYSGVLEADLWRSEAKVAAIRETSTPSSTASISTTDDISISYVVPPRGPSGHILAEEDPKSKEEGLERWKYAMTLRFLKGDDQDFEYRSVDESDEWDWLERRDREEEWFDKEEPEFEEGRRDGETGVQDF